MSGILNTTTKTKAKRDLCGDYRIRCKRVNEFFGNFGGVVLGLRD